MGQGPGDRLVEPEGRARQQADRPVQIITTAGVYLAFHFEKLQLHEYTREQSYLWP